MWSSHSTSVETPPKRSVRGAVELPDAVAHRVVVRVEEVRAVVAVAGQVELPDPLGGQAVDERRRRRSRGCSALTKTLLTSSSRPQSARLGQRGQELPLAHRRVAGR